MATAQQGAPTDAPLGELEVVHEFNGPMPTGVTVSHRGRIFVNYPKWGDAVEFTVAELRDGQEVAYPDAAINQSLGSPTPTTSSRSRASSSTPPTASGSWIPAARSSRRPSPAGRSWSAST